MDKEQIAQLLADTGTMLELKGENPFKIRAYFQGARIIEGLPGEITELLATGKLKDVRGIGRGLFDSIREILETGQLGIYNQLKEELPAGLFEILRIPGLGPKRVSELYKSLDITNIVELEYACHENRLLDLVGFGAKTQENVLKGIEFLKQNKGQFLWIEAYSLANEVLEAISHLPEVEEISIAGSLRRYKEIVKDVDIVISSAKPRQLMDSICRLSVIAEVFAKGESKISASLKSGINIDFRIVEPYQFSTALHHFTGSKEHNTALRQMANRLGLKINEYGIFRGEKLV
ncbi:MAG: helix-hairpin-helix domain-containing protein, partial [Bacillota bacterium]|nr:helix-hairpin-helix domain-containing protein [Bacillota bacterium]